jgi:hypothetical protein
MKHKQDIPRSHGIRELLTRRWSGTADTGARNWDSWVGPFSESEEIFRRNF